MQSHPEWPTISLITCSFNQARFLDATIRSVINQGYRALDYIIIDGGSRDGSVDIIERYKDRLSHWVSEPDDGQTDALKKGFALARGDIFGWLCSDDLLLPGALEAVGRYFLDHPETDAVYGDAIWLDAEGTALRAKKEFNFNHFVFLHDHNYVPQPSMFWRSRLYRDVGGLDPTFNLAMDTDLWDRFVARTRIAHMPRYLSCMRFYPEQKTRSLSRESRQESLRILSRNGSIARLSAFRPLMRLAARSCRVLLKASIGGYGAAVPPDLVPWLETHRTPSLPHCERRADPSTLAPQ